MCLSDVGVGRRACEADGVRPCAIDHRARGVCPRAIDRRARGVRIEVVPGASVASCRSLVHGHGRGKNRVDACPMSHRRLA